MLTLIVLFLKVLSAAILKNVTNVLCFVKFYLKIENFDQISLKFLQFWNRILFITCLQHCPGGRCEQVLGKWNNVSALLFAIFSLEEVIKSLNSCDLVLRPSSTTNF